MGFWDLFRSKESRERSERREAIADALLEEFSGSGLSRRQVRKMLDKTYKELEMGDVALGDLAEGNEAPESHRPDEGDPRRVLGSAIRKYPDEQLAEVALHASQAIIDQSDGADLSYHMRQMADDRSHVLFGEGEFGILKLGVFRRLEINFARAQIGRALNGSASLRRYASLFIAQAIAQGLSNGYRFEAFSDDAGRRVYELPASSGGKSDAVPGVCFVVEGVGKLMRVKFAERFKDVEHDIVVK